MPPPPATPPDACGLRRRTCALGPFAYLGALFVLALLVLGLARGLLTLDFLTRVRREPHFARLFLLGLRIDVLVVSYLLALPTVLLLLAPARVVRAARRGLVLYFATALTLLAGMEALSPSFLAQYDTRPNYLFLEYMGGSREVAGTLWAGYRWQLMALLAIGGGVFLGATRVSAWLLARAVPWPATWRLAVFPLAAAALFLGLRGTLAHRPINAASVAFSGENLVNQLALNSTYSAARAWYDRRHERAPAALYGSMSDSEVLARVGRYARWAPEDERPGDVPFLHRQGAQPSRTRPRNLVIVLEESLGAEFVGCLGGKPLTPCLDALAREGLLLTNLYCTGTRTVRGIEAVVAGFLPTPGSSVVKLPRSQSDFFTLAALLKRHGYATDFVYGGESHFDNMASFFLGNGFERALSERDYARPAFRGTWGVSDEDLMRKANELFVAHGDQPFFALILSTSNHSPYEFPDGRIQLHDAEKATRNNTVKYADYALGELFRLAKQEAYWRDTVWLVVADHDERTYGNGLIPVDKFRIPGLFLAPDLAPGVDARVASQIDLAPTALGLLGLASEHPMIGRDLRTLPADDPGRAVLQFNDVHGFLVGARLAVHPGGARPRCFRVDGARLEPIEDDPELLSDGLAHALLPGILYGSGRYRLPPEEYSPRTAAH